MPVRDQDEAMAKLKELRETYADATHHCFGLVLGVDRAHQQFSDDGEPGNSAGRPILNALLSSGISFALGVVVRYYGGKKLGIPGLIEAYGTAMQECIAIAEVKELVLMDRLVCSLAEEHQYKLFNLLHTQTGINFTFSDGQFTIYSPQSMTSELRSEIEKIPTLAFSL